MYWMEKQQEFTQSVNQMGPVVNEIYVKLMDKAKNFIMAYSSGYLQNELKLDSSLVLVNGLKWKIFKIITFRKAM